ILRPETEWIEIVASGSAKICNADKNTILDYYAKFKDDTKLSFPSIFGDGKASEFICAEIVEHL
ncbi:MAG: UDP-N-acetylglucosamine 2-epimerase (non-hydrolyzing), partial [Bacteroidales bacterium]|nr:UDP-N-acetylglucosamine 2-epimerase (non-hydrolyzing) [Bacteroidales bacterium]